MITVYRNFIVENQIKNDEEKKQLNIQKEKHR